MKTKPKTKPKTKTNGVSSPLHFSLHFFLCFFLCFLLCPGQERPEDHLTGKEITVFCFHDVRDDVHEHYDPDLTALGTTQLIRYFAWLKGNGYHPVSIDQLVAAGKGKAQLPGKPVLLTFDDGLKSIYTHIYPALKLFNFPAVVALVGAWIEGGDDLVIKYGSKLLQADDFLTWDQVRELDRTGLIEFASHSFDLHRDLPANPQGSRQPLATARLYDLAAGEYESDEVYEKRVRADLEKSIALMKKQLGKAPRAIAWPYGKYNRASAEIAASLGLEINLTLAPKINRAEEFADGLNGRPIYMSRWLISQNPVMEDFTWQLNWEVTHPLTDADPMRFVQVDLDYLYDPDPEQLERNLGALLERIRKMDIGVVFLQAFADPDGDGTASALYFPNRHLPVRADIFNRVCWQLKIRSNVKVFAWMPVMAFAPPPGQPPGVGYRRGQRAE